MTYFYYRSSTARTQVDPQTKAHWESLAKKSNWRIVQLPNGYYQAEVKDANDNWNDVTRRETMESCEAAIDASINHYEQKLLSTQGPKVVKTFE